MKESLSQQTANLKHKNNRHKRWKGIVSILACMVVFCTVYALILPALTAEGTPHCGKEEHTHTEDCYEKKLICGKEEGEGAHHHTDECYREEPVLVCTTPESDGHQHTDDCYTEEKVLTCTNADPDHVHNDIDGCYTTERKLTCGKEEGEGAHHHTEECYETKRELICGQEENDGHKHTDECYKKELVCGKEEHKHILACYSDPNADVEDGNVWQRTVSSVTLTGNWGADLAAIAQTQNGYTESTANYAVAEDGQTIHGYTRYGAWANDPYRDNWSAQFADFCLSYAGVPTSAVPQNSDCSAWNYTIPDGYTPKTGDLLLLDTDSNGSADHAGIVTSVSDSTLSAIVGDADKAVRNNTYNIGSETIKGYVSIPENPALATPTPEPTKEAEVTPEAQPTQEPEATPEVTEEPTQEPENKADDVADDKADENKTQDEDVKEDDGKKDDTTNNIEVTPTPEVTETPEATPIPTETPEVTPAPEISSTEQGDDLSWCTVVQVIDTPYIEENYDEKTDDDVMTFSDEDMINICSDEIMTMSANTTATNDFGQYITSITIEKIVNGQWTPATEFKNGDPIKVDVTYDLPAGVVDRNNNVITYQLPTGVVPKGTLTGTVYSHDNAVGTYEISADGRMTITFEPEFAGDGSSRIDGDIGFKGTISSSNTKEDQQIVFDGTGTTIIIKKDEEKPESGDVSISKTASKLSKDEIEYELKVTTQNGTKKEVTVKDWLTNAEYKQDSFEITGPDGSKINKIPDFSSDSSRNMFEIKDLPELEKGQSYTIKYKVTVSSVNTDGSCKVSNSASANDQYTYMDVEVSKPKIKKDGSYNEDTNKITWTITIQTDGDSLAGEKLKDTLDGKSLNNYTAVLKDKDDKETPITLPYTFPEGAKDQYTCTITYDTPVTGNTSQVENKAEVGGYESDKTVNITKRDWNISKRWTGQETIEDGKQRFNWESVITLPNKEIGKLNTFTYTDIIKNGTVGEHYGVQSELGTAIEQNMKITYLDDTGIIRTDKVQRCGEWIDYSIKYYKDEDCTQEAEADDNVKGYTITFSVKNSDIKYVGKSIDFTYSTIGTTNTMSEGDSATYYNTGKIPDHESSASITYNKPSRMAKTSSVTGSLVKPSGFVNDGSSSWIAGFSGKHNGVELGEKQYIYYRIVLNPEEKDRDDSEDKPDSPIILKDTLPDHTNYVPNSGYAVYCSGNSVKEVTGVWPENKGKDITDISFSQEGQTLSITLEQQSYRLEKNSNNIAIYYAVKVDDSVLDGTGTQMFKNKVLWGNREAETETEVKQVREVLKKSGSQREITDSNGKPEKANVIDYSIVINPDGKDLDKDSDKLTLTDTLTGVEQLQSIDLDLSSLKLYVYDASKSGYHGDEVIDPSRYVVAYKTESGKREFKITLPDQLACVLVYSYQFDTGSFAEEVSISNQAKLGSYTSKSNKCEVEDADSYANANKHIIIYKVDSKDFSKVLTGAEFNLQKNNQNQWNTIKSYTTGSDGKLELSIGSDSEVKKYDLNYNTVYKFTETKAPDGYTKSDKSYYLLALGKTNDQVTGWENMTTKQKKEKIWWSLFESIRNEINTIDSLQIVSGKGDTIYIKNEYTSLGVEKKWLNSNGVAITPEADSVQVQLKRQKKKPSGCKVVVESYNLYDSSQSTQNTSGEIWIKKGTSIKITWGCDWNDNQLPPQSAENFSSSLEGCTWDISNGVSQGNGVVRGIPVITTPVINQDTTIRIGTKWIFTFTINDGDYTPTDYSLEDVENVEQPISLSTANQWKYTWNQLPSADDKGNPYYYTVEEINPPSGFTVGYTNNGGIQSGEITVTNTKNTKQDYVLPETGGTGTNRFTAVGLSLMAGSLMCGYVMRRKRRERRGN